MMSGVILFSGCTASETEIKEDVKEIEETVIEENIKETENIISENEIEVTINDVLDKEAGKKEESEEEVPKDDLLTDTQEEAVVDKKIIAAYIQGFDKSNGIVYVDEIEWLTLEDRERLDALGIDDQELSDGYYINNPYKRVDEYIITENTKFSCIDYSTAEEYDVLEEEWYDKVSGQAIYWFRVIDGELVSIKEQYLP